MRTILASLLFLAACASDATITDLGELSADGKADVQSIKVPLRLAGGESAEFMVTVDGPFQVKATYPENALVTISTGTTETSSVQPTLVVEASSTPTEYTLAITNTSAAALSGTLEIGPAAPTCGDDVWVPWFNTLITKLDAAGGVIDTTEKAGIDLIVAARPCESTSDTAYKRWHEVFDAKLVAAGGVIDTSEASAIDLVKAQRPVADTEGAYLAWLPKFTGVVVGAGGIVDSSEKVHIDHRLSVRPKATTDAGYVAWLEGVAPVVIAAGSIVDTSEAAVITIHINGKPCATASAATLEAWNKLAQGASGSAASLVQAAAPTAGCQ